MTKYVAGEMVCSKIRIDHHAPGSYAFYLGNGRYHFMEDNGGSSWHSFTNDFEKVEFTEKLGGKSFCITGALDYPRDYYKKLIEIRGGKWTNSVVRNLDYLIVSDAMLADERYGYPSVKLKKARTQTTHVITFKQFLKMI